MENQLLSPQLPLLTEINMSRILLIKNEDSNLNGFEKRFAGLYYQFSNADNYHDALAIIFSEEIEIDLIVIDSAIKFIDAVELCAILKVKMHNYIPIVMVTYKQEEDLFTKFIDAGGDDIFFYPFQVDLLSNKIVSMIRIKEDINNLAARNKGFDFSNLNKYHYDINNAKIVVISDDLGEKHFIKKNLEPLFDKLYFFEKYDDFLQERMSDVELFIVSTMLASDYGLEVSTKIINNDSLKKKSILVIADINDNQLICRAIQIGAIDYIATPIQTDELISKIKRSICKNIAVDRLHLMIDTNLKLANKDRLTGALNRNALESDMKRIFFSAKANDKNLSVMMFDLDKFKNVNDTYGHLVGDEVLVETSYRITRMLDNASTLYRFGGEEFLVICEDLPEEIVVKTAETIRTGICNNKYKISVAPFHLQCSVSIGLAKLRKEDTDIEQIIKRADDALYVAKDSGRNKVVNNS